jgi:membrane-bound lytic murein transglycosylase D
MRLKPGSTIVVPRGGDDDEDISADVAENGVLAMEPDVPDTRKMLIRVRRKAVDGRARGPLRRVGRPAEGVEPHASRHRDAGSGGWCCTCRSTRAVPAEPGPERIATSAAGAHIERASLSVGGKSRGGQHAAAKPAAHAAKAAPAKAAPRPPRTRAKK